MGGTKLTDLVVEQSDRGGEMLEGIFQLSTETAISLRGKLIL